MSTLTAVHEMANERCHGKHQDAAANAAFPTLAGADAREELVLAKERATEVGSRVVCPQENEDAQRQHAVVNRHAALASERHNVDHGKG